jgi:hypothetical protein
MAYLDTSIAAQFEEMKAWDLQRPGPRHTLIRRPGEGRDP